MCDYKLSSRVTLYVTRGVFALVGLLILGLPWVLEQYHLHFRPLEDTVRRAVLVGFYVSTLAILPALWNMDRLLRNILQEQVFVAKNVAHVRVVRWCCLAVSIICLAVAFDIPAMVFLSVIMGFLFLAVTVVGQLLKAAVALQEENDLTI